MARSIIVACVTDFREGELFLLPLIHHPGAAPKRPILNRVKDRLPNLRILKKLKPNFRKLI